MRAQVSFCFWTTFYKIFYFFMRDTYLTRETLLKRLKLLDDEQAWEEFVYYYGNFINSIIYKIEIYSDDEEDIAQEVMLKIWKAIPSFDLNNSCGRFRSWLYAICKNTVINYIAKKKTRNEKLKLMHAEAENLKDSPEIDNIINEEWEKHISTKAFAKVKDSLSPTAIGVFEANLMGRPILEIAEQFNIEENTVYTYKNRVKSRLVAEIKNLRDMLE